MVESVYSQPAITVTQAPSSSCDSGLYYVGYTATGNYNHDNLFFLELSGYGGNFNNSIILDSMASTGGGSLYFQGSFPLMFTGNYRLRIRSSSPVYLSAFVEMEVTQLVPPIIGKTNNIIEILNDAPRHFYHWFRNGQPVGFTNDLYTNADFFGEYYVQARLTNCRGRNISSNVITLNPSTSSMYLNWACAGQEDQPLNLNVSNLKFELNNELIIELSDSAGNFGTTSTIVAKSSTVRYNNVQLITIPDTLPLGTGYRLRLITTNPAFISPPSPPFTLRARPPKPLIYRTGDILFTDLAKRHYWQKVGSSNLDFANASIYLPVSEGQYFLTINDSFCTSPSSDTISFFFTSTKETTQNWQIGPNPAQDVLRINSEENIMFDNLELIDISGKHLAFNFRLIGTQTLEIFTTSLSNGIYLLKYKQKAFKFMVKH